MQRIQIETHVKTTLVVLHLPAFSFEPIADMVQANAAVRLEAGLATAPIRKGKAGFPGLVNGIGKPVLLFRKLLRQHLQQNS